MKLLCAIVCSFSITSASGAFAGSPADQSYLDSLIDSASSALINAAVSALTPDVEAGASQHTATMVTETDPFETYNRWMFEFNSSLDQNALQPVAQNYRRYTPAIVQQGVSNFFSNLGDVGVVTNAVLQGKFEQALSDTARLAINSVAGIGGVIDVASMLDYEKNHEDFGQTFGVWGIPEGPYLVLPVLGPRTVRSAVGTAFDTYLQMETLGAVSEAGAGQDLVTELLSLNLVQQRAAALNKTELLEQASLDPYVFAREAYLSYRRCQVADCDRIDYVPSDPETDPQSPLDELDLLDELD